MADSSAIRFLLVGGLNTAVTYFTYAFLLWCGVGWAIASPIGYALGMINSYLLNKRWTFRDEAPVSLRQILVFVGVNISSWGVSYVFLWLFADVADIDEFLAQIPAMFFSLSINYVGSRFFVFMKRKSVPKRKSSSSEITGLGCQSSVSRIVLIILFWLFLFFVVTVVLWRAEFVFGDEEIFLRTVCKGMSIPVQVLPAIGRCCPLSHWDCNFILLLPHCLRASVPQVIYAAKAVVLALTLLVFYNFMRMSVPTDRIGRVLAFLTVLALVAAPSVMLVSCWNIFPEQRMFLLLTVFLWSVFRGVGGGSVAWYGLAGLATLVTFGYKETSFVLIGVFAGACLLGGWRRFAVRERAVFLFFGCLAIAYCAMYYFVFVGKVSASYRAVHKVGLVEAARFYAKQPEIAVALILALVRSVFFVCGRSGRHLFWDAMLFAGVAYVGSYVALQLTSIYNYYQSPAYVFLLPVFLHWLLELSRRFRFAGIAGVVLLSCLVLWNAVHTIPDVFGHLERRRTEMSAVRALAANDDVEHIYYYYPTEGLYEDYHHYLFGLYLEHVGGGVTLERISEMKNTLGDDEVLIIPMSFINPDVPIMKAPGAVRTSWYTIVYGPFNGQRPRKCGRKGVVLRAGERGVEGLGVTGDGWGGKIVTVKLTLAPTARERDLAAVLTAGVLSTPAHPENVLRVKVGDKALLTEKNVWPPRACAFTIPASCTGATNLVLSLEADRAICPSEEGLSADTRQLGVCFQQLAIQPKEKGTEK